MEKEKKYNLSVILNNDIRKSNLLKNRLIELDPDFKDIKCISKSELVVSPDCRYIFSRWGMPILTSLEIAQYFPNLEAVFYAAGSVKSFARPFLEKGIKVISATSVNAIPVAEFTIAQILLANKGYFLSSRKYIGPTRPRRYKQLKKYAESHMGNYESTVGIIGLGNIGSKVAELAKNFDLSLIGYDPYVDDEKFINLNVKRIDLEELFKISDVVTCHLPNIPETKNMIDERLLSMMKPYSTFINTGRGDTVKEKDLLRIMRKRKDLTALIDVALDSPLKLFSGIYFTPNIILSPHIAGSKGNEIIRMIDFVYNSYLQLINGEKPDGEMTLQLMESQT